MTNNWILDINLLIFGLILTAYLYMTRKFKYWKNRGVVETSPTAFVGNFGDCLIAKKSPGQWLKDMYDKGSNLSYMGFYIFDRPCLLIRDPQLIKQVLIKDFNYFDNRLIFTGPHDQIGNANLFVIKNPQWKLLRSKLTPIYTSGRLKKMFELMTVVGDDLLTLMDSLNLGGQGKILELKELCARFTTDLIATTAFGIRANCLNNPKAEFREKARGIFGTSPWRSFESTMITFAPQFGTPLRLKFMTEESVEFLRNTFWDVINDRERSEVKRGDLIDLLIELRRNKADIFNNEFDFDGDNLVAQAMVFFNAGFETSSSTLSFTLYELAVHPKIQDKLRAEIIQGLEGTDGKVTYDMTTNLPYMDMVISETLRKYPTLPVLDRVANDNYKLPDSNLVIEKGTPVMVSVRGLHYDEEYFPNPETYDPERFSDENRKTIKSCTYLPFGEGPHNCIGMRIGLLQVKLGLINLLSKYEFSPATETSMPLVISTRSKLTIADGGVFLNVRNI